MSTARKTDPRDRAPHKPRNLGRCTLIVQLWEWGPQAADLQSRQLMSIPKRGAPPKWNLSLSGSGLQMTKKDVPKVAK